jgi:hypothetical protein
MNISLLFSDLPALHQTKLRTPLRLRQMKHQHDSCDLKLSLKLWMAVNKRLSCILLNLLLGPRLPSSTTLQVVLYVAASRRLDEILTLFHHTHTQLLCNVFYVSLQKTEVIQRAVRSYRHPLPLPSPPEWDGLLLAQEARLRRQV